MSDARQELRLTLEAAFQDWCTLRGTDPNGEHEPDWTGRVTREWQRFKAAIDQELRAMEDEAAAEA